MSVASDGIWFPIANNQHPHNCHHTTDDQPADNIQPIINTHETSPSGKPVATYKPSVHSGYWSPLGTRVKADMVDGYIYCGDAAPHPIDADIPVLGSAAAGTPATCPNQRRTTWLRASTRLSS